MTRFSDSFPHFQRFHRNFECFFQNLDHFFLPVCPMLFGLYLECQDLLSVVLLRSFSASFSICLLCSIVCSLILSASVVCSRIWSFSCVSVFIFACCVPLMASWSTGAPVRLPLLRLPLSAAVFAEASQRVLCSLCNEHCLCNCSRRTPCNSTRAPCPTPSSANCGPDHCVCPHAATMSIHRTKHRTMVTLQDFRYCTKP